MGLAKDFRLQRYPVMLAGRTTSTPVFELPRLTREKFGGLGGLSSMCVVLLDETERSGVQVTTPAHHRGVGGQTVLKQALSKARWPFWLKCLVCFRPPTHIHESDLFQNVRPTANPHQGLAHATHRQLGRLDTWRYPCYQRTRCHPEDDGACEGFPSPAVS